MIGKQLWLYLLQLQFLLYLNEYMKGETHREMDNEYTRKEAPCPLSGEEYCDQSDKDCNRCIAQEEAWERIQCYINCHGYDWTYERLKHDYQTYYMCGTYCSHTCMDVIRNNEADCRLLFGKEVM